MGSSAGLPVSGAVRAARMVSPLVVSMGAMGSEKEISSIQITQGAKARFVKLVFTMNSSSRTGGAQAAEIEIYG